LITLSGKSIGSEKDKKYMKQSKGRATSESKLLDNLSHFAASSAEIKHREHELEVRRLEQQMKMEDRKLTLQEKQMELETKKLEFQMREQSHSRSGSSSKTSSSSYSESVLEASKLSSSLSPDADYDSEVSLDLRIRQEMTGTSSKEAKRYREMRLKEIAITKFHRERCAAEIANEKSIMEANHRRGELEFREKRRLQNPKWHTEEHTKERERKKALATEDWTREDYYKEKGFDPNNEEDSWKKERMYVDFDRTKRSYGRYGVSPGKTSYKSVRSSDSDLMEYDFAYADEQRKIIIEKHFNEASQMRKAVILDLTGDSPSRKQKSCVTKWIQTILRTKTGIMRIYMRISNHVATMMVGLIMTINHS
jgi:hypothetical protein